MNDDWRVQVDAADPGQALLLVEGLGGGRPGENLGTAFHDKVMVSRDENVVFLYAETRQQAEAARDAATELASENSWDMSFTFTHWHPVAERWEDPEAPLPAGDAAKLAEHAELIAAERREAAERGTPGFEVRVDLPSHGEAGRFAEQLRGEGLPVVRRWKYLVVGADDEDGAKRLAERLRAEAPGGSEVSAEGSGQVVWAERPANPFAIFGGLGG